MPSSNPETIRVELPMGPEVRNDARSTIVRGPEDIIVDDDLWKPIRTLIQSEFGGEVKVDASSIVVDGVTYYAKPKLRQWLENYVYLFVYESDKQPEPVILEFLLKEQTVKRHDEFPIIKDRFRETQIEYILRNASSRSKSRYFPTRENVLDAVNWYIKKYNVRTDQYPEVWGELLDDALWQLGMLQKKIRIMLNCAEIIQMDIKPIQASTTNETFLDITELSSEIQDTLQRAWKEVSDG